MDIQHKMIADQWRIPSSRGRFTSVVFTCVLTIQAECRLWRFWSVYRPRDGTADVVSTNSSRGGPRLLPASPELKVLRHYRRRHPFRCFYTFDRLVTNIIMNVITQGKSKCVCQTETRNDCCEFVEIKKDSNMYCVCFVWLLWGTILV